MQEIYLDANATTPVLPLAIEAARDAMEALYGNPSSSHITGLRARHILESTRDTVRGILGAQHGRIVFTSGATEAIETAVFSAICHAKRLSEASATPYRLLYGATEHKAVPQALHHWNRLLDLHAEVVEGPVDPRGQLDLEFLRAHCEGPGLVCTMAVNNETGVIHDLTAIERVVRQGSAERLWLADCVQAVGKMDLRLDELSIDYVTLSGHKIYAPKGVGVLYARESAPLFPLLAGGGQEGGARGGTENIPGVAALGAVLRCLQTKDTTFRSPEALLEFRGRLRSSLEQAFPRIVFNTPFEQSVPTTINFSVPGLASKEILDLFDAAGIRVSSGSACGSAVRGSYVLEAMQFAPWRSEGAIRMSFGPATTVHDVDQACGRIEEAGKALRDACVMVGDLGEPDDASPTLEGLVQLRDDTRCSWLLLDAHSRTCIVIDPCEVLLERMIAIVRCQQSRVLAVLQTDDHLRPETLRSVADQLGCQHAEPVDARGWPLGTSELALELDDGTAEPALNLGQAWGVARVALPGYSPGACGFLVGRLEADGKLPSDSVRYAFVGDTIMPGGLGRTDLPGGSASQMCASLQRLSGVIAPRTVLCSTHDLAKGHCTTLASELQNQPLLAASLAASSDVARDEFCRQKVDHERGLPDGVPGRVELKAVSIDSFEVPPTSLHSFFRDHAASRLIDVREPHEFRFAVDWESMGAHRPPENVPLTRLAHFLSQLLAGPTLETDLIFLCRSGNRSRQAAQVVQRLGVASARHVSGGLAMGGCLSRVDDNASVEYLI